MQTSPGDQLFSPKFASQPPSVGVQEEGSHGFVQASCYQWRHPENAPVPTQMIDLPAEDRAEAPPAELPTPETDTQGEDWFEHR